MTMMMMMRMMTNDNNRDDDNNEYVGDLMNCFELNRIESNYT